MNNNFEHLRKYAALYEIAMEVELILLTATSQAKLKMAGNCMRQIVEGMLKIVMKKYKCNYTQHLAENLVEDYHQQKIRKAQKTKVKEVKSQQPVMEMKAAENIAKAEEVKFSIGEMICDILESIVGWGILAVFINYLVVGL